MTGVGLPRLLRPGRAPPVTIPRLDGPPHTAVRGPLWRPGPNALPSCERLPVQVSGDLRQRAASVAKRSGHDTSRFHGGRVPHDGVLVVGSQHRVHPGGGTCDGAQGRGDRVGPAVGVEDVPAGQHDDAVASQVGQRQLPCERRAERGGGAHPHRDEEANTVSACARTAAASCPSSRSRLC
jgi:hypothetical protein